MPFLLVLLKINIVLSACYLLYRFFLRKLTFFNLNRAFLVASPMIAALAPFLSFTIYRQPPLPSSVQPLFIASAARSTALAVSGRDMTLIWATTGQTIFWVGVVFMAAVLLFRLGSLWVLFRNSGRILYQGNVIRVSPKGSNPFSFFQSIFLHPGSFNPEELAVIVAHEKVHIHQWHSIDMLLGALIRIGCWFNPLAWLLDKEIRKNLEFIADNKVLQQGVERRSYQLSLLSIATNGASLKLSTNFNFSHLKTRIYMMNLQRSSKRQLMKYGMSALLISGIVSGVSLSFGQQKVTPQVATDKVAQSKQAPASAPPAAPAAKTQTVQHNSRPGKPKNTATTSSPTGNEAIKTLPDDMTPREAILEQIKGIEVSRVAPPTPVVSNAPLIIVDGKVWEKSLIDIKPSTVASMSVLKDAPELAQYIDAAKNGVIVINSKK